MNGVATTGPQDPAAKEVSSDSEGKSAGVDASGGSSTTSVHDSGASPKATTQPAEVEESVSDEHPRKRRGILLGTRPGQATPAAVDDEKSLSWMATQAVKAANAVKASQLEQAQAWKAGAGMSEDEQSRLDEDDVDTIEAGESVAIAPQETVQPTPGAAPATTAAIPPVESSQETSTTPRMPPGARAAASRVPARMALMLGVLVMFGYAGYRHWFSGDHAASDATATSSAIIEPGGPAAEEVELMTPPAISVVPAPEPASEHPAPTAAEAGMAPLSGPTTGAQPATAGAAPQPAPANPASAAMPEAWYPSAVPAAPSSAAEADMSAKQAVTPSSPPPAEAAVPARQAAPPAPAVRPRYPANGYGYYQPPSSWQPYYQPGYQQAPARR